MDLAGQPVPAAVTVAPLGPPGLGARPGAANPALPITHGRCIADRIPGARFVEIPGRGTAFDDGAAPQVLAELSEFLTGYRRHLEIDGVLATALFTDIVGSTERLVALGDHQWRQVLDAHDRIVRQLLQRFAGVEIKTTGDGFHASFDRATAPFAAPERSPRV